MNLCQERFPLIMGHEPAVETAIDDTSDWVCLKNAAGVYIIVATYGGAGVTDFVLSVHESTAGSGTTAITTVFPIWVNADTATSDVMVRQTDAAGYTVDNALQDNQLVAFYIDASILSEGYDWIQLGSSGGFATNYATVLYLMDGERYQQVTPPTAIA